MRESYLLASDGPFDKERQDSFEAGLKSELADRRIRLNLAAFRNRVYDLLRQVARADVLASAIQVSKHRRRHHPGH